MILICEDLEQLNISLTMIRITGIVFIFVLNRMSMNIFWI